METFCDIIKWKREAHLSPVPAIFDTVPVPEVERSEPVMFIAVGIGEFEVICQIILFEMH